MTNYFRYLLGMVAGALLLTFASHAAPPVESAFGHGEQLTYAVSYKVGFVHTDVAEVVFRTKETTQNGHKLFDITAAGKIYPSYKWFFDINDTYTSKLDATTLKPLELQTEIREGKYRFSSLYSYDWDKMQVNTSYRNHKNPTATTQQMPLTSDSYDAIALFYNLRNMEIQKFETGRTAFLPLVLEDTIRNIRYVYLGPEVKTIKGLGKYRTLKFRCQLATSTGESFQDGSEFTLWVSDDQNKIPLYIESPIRIGSIRARLLNAKNLKYPQTSKID